MIPSRRIRGPRRLNLIFIFVSFVLFVVENSASQEQRVLKVAADPNNLPFSNQRGEGFENKIAELIARELHCKLEYHWHAQRRGFFRETLKSGADDLVIGVPAGFDMALTSEPYYRSSYVFVTRKDRHIHVASFDDAQLRKLRVGVQLIGNDGVDTPPAHALATRKIVNNVVGFTLYGDYTQDNPPARIVDAVANGQIDVAIAWGPLAGYFATQSKVPLELAPVSPEKDGALRFAFDVSLGVRKNDRELKHQLDGFLAAHREEIDRILDNYNVPRVALEPQITSAK